MMERERDGMMEKEKEMECWRGRERWNDGEGERDGMMEWGREME